VIGSGGGRILAYGIAPALLAAVVVHAQLPESSTHQSAERYQRATVGATPEEWVRHLDDRRADVRLGAVKLLAESNDPKADEYLMQAVDNSDPRVAAAAIDALGKLEAKNATPFLADRLAMAGTSSGLRQRILVALGRIKDPKAEHAVLSFVQAESDPALRSLGIRVLGEIGDGSIRGDLHGLAARENNPDVKRLLEEAETKIAAREAPTKSASPP
jgi:HEAT repeat protein